jgi:hypothetical protein
MPRLARNYKKFERKFFIMKKKSYKKIISIILASALTFGLLTAVLADGEGTGGFLAAVKDSGIFGGAGALGIGEDYGDVERILSEPPSGSGSLFSTQSSDEDSSFQAPEVSDLMSEDAILSADEMGQYRAGKLAALSVKYPDEYEYITSRGDIEPFFYVDLLERVDYWLISDLEEYIDAYAVDGFDGLDDFHTEKRNADNAGNTENGDIEEGTGNE